MQYIARDFVKRPMRHPSHAGCDKRNVTRCAGKGRSSIFSAEGKGELSYVASHFVTVPLLFCETFSASRL